jgi:hypothetical protein
MSPKDIAKILAEEDTIPENGIITITEPDTRQDEDYDPEELRMGIEVEKEHTDDEELAKRITKDHLDEFKDYYSRLKKMEDQAKKELGKPLEESIGQGVGLNALKRDLFNLNDSFRGLSVALWDYVRLGGRLEDVIQKNDPLSRILRARVKRLSGTPKL